jgi:uncharacterized protein
MTNQPDFARAYAYVSERLRRDLPATLSYHNAYHTLEEVLPAAERLAAMAGLNGEEVLLLRTAALYHDVGYVETRAGHEEVSAQIAAATLPAFCYSAHQVARIVELIRATKLPHQPGNLLAEIMADADLDSLGSDNFAMRNDDLRAEMAAHGEAMPDCDWYRHEAAFLQAHCYFTPMARALRDAGKQHNLRTVLAQLASCEVPT